MKNIQFLCVLSVVAALTSCAPVYKCGETRPVKAPLTWSKNLKTVVSERDKLCMNLAAKEKENTALKNNVSELTNANMEITEKYKALDAKNSDLQEKYNSLISENLSQAEQFNKTLKAKSDELNEKERILTEREKALQELQKVIARQDSITKRLTNILRNALLGFNSDELSVEIINGKVYVSLSDKLLFKSGSSTVEDKGKEALKLLADVLNKNPDIDILVEGHTDNVPIRTAIYKDNWDLSVARATSIVRILSVDYKILPTRMTASGKGEYFPKAGNETSEGRAKNRRTEIILSPKLEEIMQLIRE
jgi:chemotaxis protein MotB